MSSKQQMSGSNKSIKTSKGLCLSSHLVLQMDLSFERCSPSSFCSIHVSNASSLLGELEKKWQMESAVSIVF